jgi:hypothetical protein
VVFYWHKWLLPAKSGTVIKAANMTDLKALCNIAFKGILNFIDVNTLLTLFSK